MSANASAHAAPMLGCPANGSSRVGVKIRSRYVAREVVGGSVNAVSDSPNSAASACICRAVSVRARCTTASGLPAYGRSVKTSTMSKCSPMRPSYRTTVTGGCRIRCTQRVE